MRSNCILQKHLFTWECWTLINHMYNIMLVDSPSQHGEYNDAKTPDVNGSIIALLLQYLERLMNNTDKYCPPKYTHTQPYHTHTHTHACIHTSTRTRTHTHACAHTQTHPQKIITTIYGKFNLLWFPIFTQTKAQEDKTKDLKHQWFWDMQKGKQQYGGRPIYTEVC